MIKMAECQMADLKPSQTHPLQIPEILDTILSYLPARDLRSCALVSNMWNKSAHHIFSKRNQMKVFSFSFELVTPMEEENPEEESDSETLDELSQLTVKLVSPCKSIETNALVAMAWVTHSYEYSSDFLNTTAKRSIQFPCELWEFCLNHSLFYKNKQISVVPDESCIYSAIVFPNLADVHMYHFSLKNYEEFENTSRSSNDSTDELEVSLEEIQSFTGIAPGEKVKFILSFYEDFGAVDDGYGSYTEAVYCSFRNAILSQLKLPARYIGLRSSESTSDYGVDVGPMYIAFCGDGVNIVAYGHLGAESLQDPDADDCIDHQIRVLKKEHPDITGLITVAFVVTCNKREFIAETFSKYFPETFVIALDAEGSDLYHDGSLPPLYPPTVSYVDRSAFYLLSFAKH